MIALVTGATGFIGQRLTAQLLGQGFSTRILTRGRHPLPERYCKILFYGDSKGEVEMLIPFVDGVDVLYRCAGEIRDQVKMYSVYATVCRFSEDWIMSNSIRGNTTGTDCVRW